MDNKNHTPGNWKGVTINLDKPLQDATKTKIIASNGINRDRIVGVIYATHKEQGAANAQLVTAAPIMLEALLKVKELNDGGHIFLGALTKEDVDNAIKLATKK